MHYIHFFAALTETVRNIAVGGGYATLFVVMLLEGLPLLGMAVPGHVAIITAGFLSAASVLDPVKVCVIGLAGALLGDCASFYIGRAYGWPLIEKLRRHFFISESVLEKAKSALAKHTGKALVFGRFNPVTRGIMPFLVGANRSPAGSFWLYDGLGTAAWILSSVAIGYLVGFGYHAAAAWMGKLAVAAIIAAILIIWGYRFVNVRFHIFRRYELFVLALNLLSLYSLSRMLEDAAAARPFMAAFDVWLNGIMSGLSAVPAGLAAISVSLWMNYYAGPAAVSIATVAIGIWLSARHKWRSAAILLASVGSAAVSTAWLKEIFMRARPTDLLVPYLSTDPSFPSGHAAFSAALFLAVAYIFAPRIASWVKRELFLVVCIILPIAIGLSRLVLNVHWASDVIAGWALGAFCATGSVLLLRYIAALIYPAGSRHRVPYATTPLRVGGASRHRVGSAQ